MMQLLYGSSAIVVIGLAAALFVVIHQYKKSTYYQVTGNSYFSVIFDLGKYGEYLTYKYLRAYEEEGAKFLYNCYLPRDNDDTTEIDVLMIYKSGLYVFESKNYSGWIFGDEKSKTWTQTLPQGRKSHKEHFLNPIMQNKLHIKWLKNLIQDESIPVHSVIVFSERCTLKKVSVSSPEIAVIKRDNVRRTVMNIDSNTGDVLPSNKVLELYEKLYPYSQASAELKQAHVDGINGRLQQKEQSEKIISEPSENEVNAVEEQQPVEEMICPKCGALLVLRMAKKGKNAGQSFYGCSSFPKCKYVKGME